MTKTHFCSVRSEGARVRRLRYIRVPDMFRGNPTSRMSEPWQRHLRTISPMPTAPAQPAAPNAPATEDVSFISANRPFLAARMMANIVPRPPLCVSPDRIYRPHSNPMEPVNAGPNAGGAGSGPANAAPVATEGIGASAARTNPADANATRQPPSVGSRCPFVVRRLSASSMLSNYPSCYGPPAYVPHAALWSRQQINQENHRRHMMGSMSGGISSDSVTPNTFTSYPNRTNPTAPSSAAQPACQTCTHPPRRPRYVPRFLPNLVRFLRSRQPRCRQCIQLIHASCLFFLDR